MATGLDSAALGGGAVTSPRPTGAQQNQKEVSHMVCYPNQRYFPDAQPITGEAIAALWADGYSADTPAESLADILSVNLTDAKWVQYMLSSHGPWVNI